MPLWRCLPSTPGWRCCREAFDSFADQCHFGLQQITTSWCLSLDADHLITPEFRAELAGVHAAAPVEVAAVLPFRCHVQQPLRGTLLPPAST